MPFKSQLITGRCCKAATCRYCFYSVAKNQHFAPQRKKTMNWIKKWLTPFYFRMGTTSSTTVQSLGEIEQRAPAVGAKMWCLLPAGCREAANCRYCFYSQAKNQVFRPAGTTSCTDSGQTLQDRRAPGSAWLCKISPQSPKGGGNAAPKISKISTFL